MLGSPKKKSSKWKATDSDLKAPKRQKDRMSHKTLNIQDVQVLGKETNQAKGATSLDMNAPANPPTPELPHKGCGSHSRKKQPPLLVVPQLCYSLLQFSIYSYVSNLAIPFQRLQAKNGQTAA
ncbi:hypothetical protein BDR06DRAFT_1015100 [Suillus hirtellus]|nr:hypothetical protein BDR06DRAFT_1015100 [Suillus hirtellus]